MDLEQLRRNLGLIASALDNRVEVWREVIDVNGRVIRRIYRGSFNAPRDSRSGEPHTQKETP